MLLMIISQKLTSMEFENYELVEIDSFYNLIVRESPRKQLVKQRNCKNEWLPITIGLHQGTIFGLLLSAMYVNDIFLRPI